MNIVQGVQCKALINAWHTRSFLVKMSFPFLSSSFMSANGLVEEGNRGYREDMSERADTREPELCQRQRADLASPIQGLALDPFMLASSGT